MEWTSVKKGWVYQRKKHLFLPTSWSPKYLVLYSAPIPALAVYEQRSDAMPPYAPLLHIDLTSGDVIVTTVNVGGSGRAGWMSQLAEGIGSSVASRKASIVSALSRKGSFRNLGEASASTVCLDEKKTKSYKERMLDEQGFMVSRSHSSQSPSLKVQLQ